MPNGTYGGVRGRKTKVGRKLLRFPPTRLWIYVYQTYRLSGEMLFLKRFMIFSGQQYIWI